MTLQSPSEVYANPHGGHASLIWSPVEGALFYEVWVKSRQTGDQWVVDGSSSNLSYAITTSNDGEYSAQIVAVSPMQGRSAASKPVTWERKAVSKETVCLAAQELSETHPRDLEAVLWWMRGFVSAHGGMAEGMLPLIENLGNLSGILRKIIAEQKT